VFQEYKSFQEEQGYRIMVELVRRIRASARRRGRSLAIGANLAGMGDGAVYGASVLGLPIWDRVFDFIIFEEGIASETDFGKFRQNSFAPHYRLGRAIVPGLVAALPGAGFADLVFGRKNSTYLAILYSEAFAFEGNWAIAHWWHYGWPSDALAPASLAELTQFVKRYRSLYEGPRRAADIAVVYASQAILARPEKHYSFMWLCKALGNAQSSIRCGVRRE
jgi:hypothetical protein